MLKQTIPSQLVSIISNIIAESETHATLDNLFMYANAPGHPPIGNKIAKAQTWLMSTNQAENCDPLSVLGKLIEKYMENIESDYHYWNTNPDYYQKRKVTIEKALEQANLIYIQGGKIVGAYFTPSKTLKDIIKTMDYKSVTEEFDRAIKNIGTNPREAVSAACNILESICKIYIEEEGLTMPAKKDIQSVWKIVRDRLGFDPSSIEDRDLQEIISGLFATVGGVGAIRTHASSAHGAGKKMYKLKPRHARLAIHAAHTVAIFILETWNEHRERKHLQK